MSEDSTKAGMVDITDGGLIKFDLDYCDQAKYGVPRNELSTKAADNLWKPRLQLAGCICWGATYLLLQCHITFLTIMLHPKSVTGKLTVVGSHEAAQGM